MANCYSNVYAQKTTDRVSPYWIREKEYTGAYIIKFSVPMAGALYFNKFYTSHRLLATIIDDTIVLPFNSITAETRGNWNLAFAIARNKGLKNIIYSQQNGGRIQWLWWEVDKIPTGTKDIPLTKGIKNPFGNSPDGCPEPEFIYDNGGAIISVAILIISVILAFYAVWYTMS